MYFYPVYFLLLHKGENFIFYFPGWWVRFSGILSNVRTRFESDSFNLVVSVGLSGGDNHGSMGDRFRKIRGTEAGDRAEAGVVFYRFFPYGYREKRTRVGGNRYL